MWRSSKQPRVSGLAIDGDKLQTTATSPSLQNNNNHESFNKTPHHKHPTVAALHPIYLPHEAPTTRQYVRYKRFEPSAMRSKAGKADGRPLEETPRRRSSRISAKAQRNTVQSSPNIRKRQLAQLPETRTKRRRISSSKNLRKLPEQDLEAVRVDVRVKVCCNLSSASGLC